MKIDINDKESLKDYIISVDGFQMAKEIAIMQNQEVTDLLHHRTLYLAKRNRLEVIPVLVVKGIDGTVYLCNQKNSYSSLLNGGTVYDLESEANNDIAIYKSNHKFEILPGESKPIWNIVQEYIKPDGTQETYNITSFMTREDAEEKLSHWKSLDMAGMGVLKIQEIGDYEYIAVRSDKSIKFTLKESQLYTSIYD